MLTKLMRHLNWEKTPVTEDIHAREWLVTNGLGGYASGSVAGVNTRRYHGLLVAALPAPSGRVVMLGQVKETLRLPGGDGIPLTCEETDPRHATFPGQGCLEEFRLEDGLPVWRFTKAGFVLEKRILLPHKQNTVMILYRLLEGDSAVQLELRPALHFRPHEEPVDFPLDHPYVLTVIGDRYEISGRPGLPPLRLKLQAEKPTLTVEEDFRREIFYRVEAERGYESLGSLWSPGYFFTELHSGGSAALVASTEPWSIMLSISPEEVLRLEEERRHRLLLSAGRQVHEDFARELVLAADQFLITPTTRPEEAARAAAGGDEVGTIIAGYHWFTDWGRDTMISLEGLALTTGRYREAGCILRTFAHYIRDGLIPNMFPEGKSEGLYHTADATLWFFQALDRYFQHTGDRLTLRNILPGLQSIVEHHIRGTRFGIRVDPADGLVRQGEAGYQLTWMDAKVGDWVVTPRRGKAVEINALWYNALRLLEGWIREEQGEEAARPLAERAEQARQSFNRRFWNPRRKFLFDLVDGENGDDPVCRPNQVLAISLTHPVLDEEYREPVVAAVKEHLLTPVGLRSLESGAPDYKPRYFGDIHARDAAYHQGTVWGWLIGPFVDAWLKVHPEDRRGARRFLEGFVSHFEEAGVGSISEIFDADPPFTPRGCIAQAWSVAEVLRCWVKTGE
jgi:predicted glycogen debranching enzyme